MKIKYRGKQLGWRIYLWKGAIQIDIGGKSQKLKFPVIQLSAWDDLRQGFTYVECYKNKGIKMTTAGFEKYQGDNHVSSELLYVNPRLAKTGCNTKPICDAFKKYQKKESEKGIRKIKCGICDGVIQNHYVYCPWCGILLTRTNYKEHRLSQKSDKKDWMNGYFIGDGT